MKLKRTQEPEMIAPMPAVGGGAATVDSFNLGAEAVPASAGAQNGRARARRLHHVGHLVASWQLVRRSG